MKVIKVDEVRLDMKIWVDGYGALTVSGISRTTKGRFFVLNTLEAGPFVYHYNETVRIIEKEA